MTKWILGFVLFLQAISLQAQGFQPHWIGYPDVDSTSQIWFRQTYLCEGRPQFAMLEVVTTGYFDLYVNGYNVSTDVRMPFRKQAFNDRPISLCFDITRFLRPDSNTIAVWYSPSYPHIQPRQVAISYYGRDAENRPFSLVSDSNWLCRKANVRLDTTYDEIFHASDYSQTQWNAADFAPACWQGAVSLAADNSRNTDYHRVAYTAERVTKIITPAYYVVEGDTVCYEFNTGFHGYVRVTLRDANMGERLNINGLGYQCSGEMDEQAYRKFTRQTFRNVWITGDQHFKNSQIQRVEGIETAPYPHISWH